VSRYYSYLNTSAEIIKQYNGTEPLAVFLKSFFAANKKYGSKDRKLISHLCYCFFRTGKMFSADEGVKDEAYLKLCLTAALFLCTCEANELLLQLEPQWNELVRLPVPDKFNIVKHQSSFSFLSSLSSVFPWKDKLSETIDHTTFCNSFFIQPDLFIRVRPGYKERVQHILATAQIPYHLIGDSCISLPNHTKAQDVLTIDKEIVIQDYSSQRIAEYMPRVEVDKKYTLWDCCAASGGKSILAKDILNNIELTVSDIRPSILANLAKRFDAAGIHQYTSRIADLSNTPHRLFDHAFDMVICDAPCSGSGTWGRTPEQLFYFNEEQIMKYHLLQKKIVQHIIPYIKPGGYLLYVTCSVFKKENEDVVAEAIASGNMQIIKGGILKGYDKKADTMFAALLQKQSEK
jgi:16S rRNA (cytosine967-C5)-methyltransferase